MSPVVPPKAPARAVPKLRPPQPPSAEVLVGPRTLTVTVALPRLAMSDVEIVLTRNSVRVRDRHESQAAQYIIALPVEVEPERYVMRHTNGVFDFVVERASH